MINYSQTIINYDIYLKYAVPYIALRGVDLGLNADQLLQYAGLPPGWNPSFGKYLDPGTHGTANIAQIHSIYKTDSGFTNGIKQIIKNNTLIILTPMDYIVLDIHLDAPRRSSIPAPGYRIGVVCKTFNHLNNVYQVFDIENLTHGAKPKDVKRIKWKMLVQSVALPPPTIDRLIDQEPVTTMIFDVPYTADEEHLIAYIAVCFSNDSGDGHYSSILASPII